jgi:hypothetical protein
MRLQPQLLSQKRFDEHLHPLPFGGPITTALQGLDESGIQAAYSDGNLLHLKPFNLNFTFGIRTKAPVPVASSESTEKENRRCSEEAPGLVSRGSGGGQICWSYRGLFVTLLRNRDCYTPHVSSHNRYAGC